MTLVVLTGATRGIGQAAAVELARQGAEVALVGRERERVQAVAADARAAGGGAPVHEHVADLTLMAEVRRLADQAKRATSSPRAAHGAGLSTHRRKGSAQRGRVAPSLSMANEAQDPA